MPRSRRMQGRTAKQSETRWNRELELLVGELWFPKVKHFSDCPQSCGMLVWIKISKERKDQTSQIIETCCPRIEPESRIHQGTSAHRVSCTSQKASYTYHFATLGKLPVHSASGTLRVVCNVGSSARLNGGGIHSSIWRNSRDHLTVL